MNLSYELQEIVERYKNHDEKSEVYSYVFRFDQHSEYFFYVLFKYYQQGRGALVLSSERGLIDKKEAVEISFYFLTHNGTAISANKEINTTRKRKKEFLMNVVDSLYRIERHFQNNDSINHAYKEVVKVLKLQYDNVNHVEKIYQEIVENDQVIHNKTKELNVELWKRGRELVQKYNVLMYEEMKVVLESWKSADELVHYLENLGNLNFMEKLKLKKVLKQLKELFSFEQKNNVLKSQEGFEKDFQGNYFTSKRGELSAEEYKELTNKIMEKEYMENLWNDVRNP